MRRPGQGSFLPRSKRRLQTRLNKQGQVEGEGPLTLGGRLGEREDGWSSSGLGG